MPSWNRKQGDEDDTIDVYLGGIADITGCTVTGRVRHQNRTVAILDGSVLNAVASGSDRCSVRINLGSDENGWLATAEPGKWNFEQHLVFPSGAELTWPAKGHDQIWITEALVAP